MSYPQHVRQGGPELLGDSVSRVTHPVVEGRKPQFLSGLFECPLGRAANSRVLEPLCSVTRGGGALGVIVHISLVPGRRLCPRCFVLYLPKYFGRLLFKELVLFLTFQLCFSWCLVFVPQRQCFCLPVAVRSSASRSLPESASPNYSLVSLVAVLLNSVLLCI